MGKYSKCAMMCLIVWNIQIQRENPVPNNEMYELRYWNSVPQTVPPCLEWVACDEIIGFWSELSCQIALWEWACHLASADLWFTFCRTEGEMWHWGSKTLKFSLLLRAHDGIVLWPFVLCIHSWFDECWPELWRAVRLEARSPDVPWLYFSHCGLHSRQLTPYPLGW